MNCASGGALQNRLARNVAISVNAASASAPSQRQKPVRIIADAPSSSAIVAAASGTAGDRPKCCISVTALEKSNSLTNPPCR
jgi:hypothetical protein